MNLTTSRAKTQVSTLNKDSTVNVVSNTIIESDIYRTTIVGGTMGSSGCLRISHAGHLLNNAGQQSARIRIMMGPVGCISSTSGVTVIYDSNHATISANASERAVELHCFISNDAVTQQGSLGSDRLGAVGTTDGVAADTAPGEDFMAHNHNTNIDTTIDRDLAITLVFGTASPSLIYTSHFTVTELLPSLT